MSLYQPVRHFIVVFACLLALLLEWQRPDFVTRLDESLRDNFIRAIAVSTPEERLTVIDIDEASLAEVGTWPWRRAQVADLVEILLGYYSAQAVGLDIVFPKKSDREGDMRLAALAAHAPLTLAQIFDYTPRSPALALGHLIGEYLAGEEAVEAYGYIANHTGLSGAKCVGNIGYLPDSDGVLRHAPVITRYQQQDYRYFSMALLECGRNTSNILSIAKPVTRHGWWRIPFPRATTAYTVIPAAEILKKRAPVALLKGRYVLVGSSSLSLGDRVSTPLAPLSVGVMVHAASLSGLLDQAEGGGHVAWAGHLLFLGWLIPSLALFTICLSRLTAWSNLLILLGIMGGWLALALWGISTGAEISVTAPLWAYLFLLVTSIPHEWWQAQRRTRKLLNTFSHYVAQPVLAEILRRDLSHSLEPTLLEVTVLIADMEGYTRTTSSLSLPEAAILTKEFLDCLTRPVLEYGGTLDKYSGDGLVSFWGAPLPCTNQADRAVTAGLAILNEVAALNQRRADAGFKPVRVRIGIESGMALVGDLGTPFRSTYTAVGDCINFASRLESAAQNLPTDLVIGEAANARLREYRTRSLGNLHLRGTNTTNEVFTVENAPIAQPDALSCTADTSIH